MDYEIDNCNSVILCYLNHRHALIPGSDIASLVIGSVMVFVVKCGHMNLYQGGEEIIGEKRGYTAGGCFC